MTNLCIYHKADADGCCSAAIVYRYFNKDCTLYGIDYGELFNFQIVDSYDQVYMVDFTLQPFEQQVELIKQCNEKLIWLDHHVGAYKEYIAKDWSGYSFKGGVGETPYPAACQMVWRYLYPDTDVPWAVALVSAWDSWEHYREASCKEFSFGLMSIDISPTNTVWDVLLPNDDEEEESAQRRANRIDAIMQRGRGVMGFNDMQAKKTVPDRAFFTDFVTPKGTYSAVACNYGKGSYQFRLIEGANDVDFRIVFERRITNWKLHLYSKTHPCDEIAGMFGGGGHSDTGGFECTTAELLQILPGICR